MSVLSLPPRAMLLVLLLAVQLLPVAALWKIATLSNGVCALSSLSPCAGPLASQRVADLNLRACVSHPFEHHSAHTYGTKPLLLQIFQKLGKCPDTGSSTGVAQIDWTNKGAEVVDSKNTNPESHFWSGSMLSLPASGIYHRKKRSVCEGLSQRDPSKRSK